MLFSKMRLLHDDMRDATASLSVSGVSRKYRCFFKYKRKNHPLFLGWTVGLGVIVGFVLTTR